MSNLVEDWLVVPKLLYFGINVIIYSTHAFIMQFVLAKWQLQKHQFGLTNFVQFTNLIGSFVFARLADRTGKYRMILAMCVFGYTFMHCMLMFPPMFLSLNLRLAYYLFLNAACFFFTAGTFPLLDSMVMSKLSANPKLGKELFGRQRLWGTIGHCIIGVIVHQLEHWTNDQMVMFYTLIVSSALFIVVVFTGIPADLKIEAHKHGHGHGASDKKPASGSAEVKIVEHGAAVPAAGPKPSAWTLLKNPSFSFFLVTVFVAGFVRSIITTYQSGFITEVLFYDKGTVANSIFVRVFPEVTLYFFSKELTQFLGVYWVLLIGHAAGVIRMFGYTQLPANPDAAVDAKGKRILGQPSTPVYIAIFALECLKGINSSMVISSAARIASDMAPKGLSSTAQGLVSGTWQGLSMTLGSLIGSYILVMFFEIKGTFVISSILGGICVILIALKFALIDRVLLTGRRKTVA